jgi:ketosteroid isomerase-like protein
MSNRAIIQQVYDALATGDFATVLGLCDPDCVITQDDALPWGGRYKGHDGFASFGLALAGTIASEVSVEALFETGEQVVQYGRTRGTVRASGAPFDIPETHVWTLRDGRIVAADFYIETATMLGALAAAS